MSERNLNELLSFNADHPPFRLDEEGAVRIGNTRIPLDLVVSQYENGMTPEEMVRAYDTLDLADVHAAIAYYLRHRDEVRAYLKRREAEAASLRARIETERPRLSAAELLAHRPQRRPPMLRLASDADVHGDIIRGLWRRRPGIDLLRSQDSLPLGSPDADVLTWAASAGRVLITNDRNSMVGLAYRCVASGDHVPGLIVTSMEQSIGSAIDDILLLAECMSADEVSKQIAIFLPFRG